jgi:prepilin-type N-terminal cleavage/methylation domain-containing protein
MKKNKIKNNNGFTLIEALISIAILMLSVAAPLSLAGKGLIAADLAQRQIVAFYLAQDAIESLINKKTSNKLN